MSIVAETNIIDVVYAPDRLARAVIVPDVDPQQPYGDALAPAVFVRFTPAALVVEYAADVYVPQGSERVMIDRAVRHFGTLIDGFELFTRWLTMSGVATAVDVLDDDGDKVLIFDTPAYREHIELPAGTAMDLAGECTEWRAYLDGDVLGVVIETIEPGADDDDEDNWTAPDVGESLWNVFGIERAREVGAELLDDMPPRDVQLALL